MKSFSFTTTVRDLQRKSKTLDFQPQLDREEIEETDGVRVDYNAKTDTLTGVIVNNGQAFGHVIDPTSAKQDPDLIEEMANMAAK